MIIDIPSERNTNLNMNIEEAIPKLSDILKEKETKHLLEKILDSYKTFDKTTIMGRASILRDDLGLLIGEEPATVLFSLITTVGKEADEILNFCKSEEQKKILKEFNAIYSPFFGGCNVVMPNDWFRVNWHTYIDALSKEPILNMKIFKRNGEHFDIESRTGTWLLFISYVLQQLAPVIEKSKGGKADPQFIALMEGIKQNMDIISSKFTPITDKPKKT